MSKIGYIRVSTEHQETVNITLTYVPIRKQLRTTDVRLLSAGSQIGLLQV